MTDSESPSGRRWPAIVTWLVLLAGLAAAFYGNFREMWARWFPAWDRLDYSLYDRLVEGESYYTHAPLMPLLAVLIAVLLIRHTKIRVRPRPIVGGVLLCGALLFHLMSCLARVNFASGFAFVGVLGALVVLFWGFHAFRRLWFPLALLLFMVPLPEVAISDVNFRLKMLAADWGVTLSQALGVIVERSGNHVFLQGTGPIGSDTEFKSLVIANVCNGLRTLISLLAFGALYAYVCRLRGLWRIGLFLMSVPVAIVSNSVRIVALIVVADVWDVETATGWFHDSSGVLIFVVAFLLMFGIERVVLWARRAAGRPAEVKPLFHDVRRDEEDAGQWERMLHAARTHGGVAAAALTILAAVGAIHLSTSIPPVWDAETLVKALPKQVEFKGTTFRGQSLTLDRQALLVLETTDYSYRRYMPEVPGTVPAFIDVCVIYSKDNRKGTHPPELCVEGTGTEITDRGYMEIGDLKDIGAVRFRELIVQSGPQDRQYYCYIYKCGGDYTSSFLAQQLSIFANGLIRRDASGALIRVSAPVGSPSLSMPEARKLRARVVEVLRQTLPPLHAAMKR